jgi:hypothetical protein
MAEYLQRHLCGEGLRLKLVQVLERKEKRTPTTSNCKSGAMRRWIVASRDLGRDTRSLYASSDQCDEQPLSEKKKKGEPSQA